MDRYEVEWVRENVRRHKSADWYWVIAILASAGIVIAFLLSNVLLATIIGLAAIVLMLLAHAEPHETKCRLTPRELTVNETVYPLRTMGAYHIDEKGGELVMRFTTDRILLPLVVIHIPLEYAETIDMIMASAVPAEYLEEEFSHKVLDILGI